MVRPNRIPVMVDALMKMGILASKDLEDWCFGRILYLEREGQ